MERNIIFVHGFASSKLIWMNQVKAVARLGWKAHAIDLLGHGDGKKPASVNEFNITSMYEAFLEEVSKLNINGQLVFVGHSLGCYLSILHALEHPTKTRGLILIAPLVNPKQFMANTSLAFKYPQFGSHFLKRIPFWMIRSFIGNDVINSSGLPDDQINQLAWDYKRADPRIVYIGRTLWNLQNSINNVKCEVSLLWGKKDNTLNPVSFEELRKTFMSKNICAISDGGHSIHLTHAEVVNLAIEEFLRQIDN